MKMKKIIAKRKKVAQTGFKIDILPKYLRYLKLFVH